MLLYRIDDSISKINDRSGDFGYMVDLLMDDYNNYFEASSYLQNRFDFSLQAIYSCLSKVNNYTNRLTAYRELSKFLGEIKKRAGLNMEIINDRNEMLSVREKPKIKSKKFIGLI